MREIGVSRRTKFPVEGHTSPSPASPKLGRWLASLAGSQASYAQADGLLRELSGLNFGAKRIEWTTRTVGGDPDARGGRRGKPRGRRWSAVEAIR